MVLYLSKLFIRK